MRDKAEKRKNDYFKAKRKEKIYNSKNKNYDETIRGFFGKLRKGKIPDIRSCDEIENDTDYINRSDKRKKDKMDFQLEEYYKELLEDLYDED